MIDTDWFRLRMEIQKISQRKLAKAIGMDPGALSLTLRGMRKMQIGEANRIAQVLLVPTVEVIRAAGIDELSGEKTVPVVGYVDTDSSVTIDEENLIARVAAPPDLPSGSMAVQFKPGYPGGFLPDALAFFQRPSGISHDAIQRLSVVHTKSGETLCCFLRRGIRSGTYVCGDKQIDLEWASPILWIKT